MPQSVPILTNDSIELRGKAKFSSGSFGSQFRSLLMVDASRRTSTQPGLGLPDAKRSDEGATNDK